jgi:hypothetical protein
MMTTTPYGYPFLAEYPTFIPNDTETKLIRETCGEQPTFQKIVETLKTAIATQQWELCNSLSKYAVRQFGAAGLLLYCQYTIQHLEDNPPDSSPDQDIIQGLGWLFFTKKLFAEEDAKAIHAKDDCLCNTSLDDSFWGNLQERFLVPLNSDKAKKDFVLSEANDIAQSIWNAHFKSAAVSLAR